MQANVFSPAGVQNVGFAPMRFNQNALADRFIPPNLLNNSVIAKGWNSGDLSSMAGGAAFRLSVKELLNVMNHVWRKNSILPSAKAQYMLDNSFGIDQQIDTPRREALQQERAVEWRRPHGAVRRLFPSR